MGYVTLQSPPPSSHSSVCLSPLQNPNGAAVDCSRCWHPNLALAPAKPYMISCPSVSHKYSNFAERHQAHTTNFQLAAISRFPIFLVRIFIVFNFPYFLNWFFAVRAGWPNFFPAGPVWIAISVRDFWEFKNTTHKSNRDRVVPHGLQVKVFGNFFKNVYFWLWIYCL